MSLINMSNKRDYDWCMDTPLRELVIDLTSTHDEYDYFQCPHGVISDLACMDNRSKRLIDSTST